MFLIFVCLFPLRFLVLPGADCYQFEFCVQIILNVCLFLGIVWGIKNVVVKVVRV